MKTLHLSILVLIFILLVPLSFVYGDMLEVQNMSVYTNKDSYGKGDIIRISGEIQSANGLTVSKDIPITIVLTNNILQKTMETLKTYPSINGNFAVADIPTTNSSWESSGTYTVTAFYGNIVHDTTTFSFEMGDKNLLPPLQQSKLGVPTDKIECRSDLQLITKAENNSTACVKQQTAQILVERGWTRTSPLKSSIDIIGLNAEYTVGQPIDATVNYTGWMNGGLYPDVKILNTNNGSKVWVNCLYAHSESPGGGGIGTDTYNVKCGDKYPIMNETGTYTMIASVDNNIAKARFDVISNTNENDGQNLLSNSTSNGPEFKVGPDLLRTKPHQLVFFMKSNSTAKIFVEYTSNEPNTGTMPSYSSVYVGKENYTPLTASDVIINADPSSIPLTEGSDTIVVYNITAKEGVKGVYWIFLAQFCRVMPLAIDINSLVISPFDIPVQMGTMSCPAQFLDGKILGISGGTVEYKIGQPMH